MSLFRGSAPGMIGGGLGVGLVAFIVHVKIEKDAAGVNIAAPAVPGPAPPLFWPAYDAGPMRPGEHLYRLITADDKGVPRSRANELLPKLPGCAGIQHPPAANPPPAFP